MVIGNDCLDIEHLKVVKLYSGESLEMVGPSVDQLRRDCMVNVEVSQDSLL